MWVRVYFLPFMCRRENINFRLFLLLTNTSVVTISSMIIKGDPAQQPCSLLVDRRLTWCFHRDELAHFPHSFCCVGFFFFQFCILLSQTHISRALPFMCAKKSSHFHLSPTWKVWPKDGREGVNWKYFFRSLICTSSASNERYGWINEANSIVLWIQKQRGTSIITAAHGSQSISIFFFTFKGTKIGVFLSKHIAVWLLASCFRALANSCLKWKK